MVEFIDENRSRGLVYIGIHCQNVPKDRVLALCRAHKVNFSVYGSGKIKGCDFSGIPKVFAFNWKGEMVYDGRLDGMEDAVEIELKKAPDWLTGPGPYRALKSEAGKIARRKSMGSVAKALRGMAAGDDEAKKKEARELLTRLTAYADRAMKRAESLTAEGNPLKARSLWKLLAKQFKGDEIGNTAQALEKERSKDKAFKKELSAAKLFTAIERTAAKIKPKRRGESPDKWRKKNFGAIKGVLGLFSRMKKKFGDTKVFARAEAYVNSMDLR